MHTQFDIPTRPMIWVGPNCRGACQQGRADCLHPMICGGQLTAAELDDALAEVNHDTHPATLDDIKAAGRGVAEGMRTGLHRATQLLLAAWKAM